MSSDTSIFRHYSDLYVYATPITKKIVDEWFKEQRLNQDSYMYLFKDNITGRPMYNIAFQYYAEI